MAFVSQNKGMCNKTDTSNAKGLRTWVVILGMTVIVLITVAYAICMVRHWPYDPSKREAFGDMFGGLNTLFSGFAFAGVIFALFFQQKQFKQNTDQIRAHQAEMKEQGRLADRQVFMSQLFQLVNSWQDIVHNTCYDPDRGRQAFHRMAGDLRARIKGNVLQREAFTRARTVEIYDQFFENNALVPLGNVFRILYHIFKFISDAKCLNDNDKYETARLIRAYLSDSELTLLYYNGLSKHGEKFFDLIEKYDLLQNFSFGGVLEQEQSFYPKTHSRRTAARQNQVQ